VLVRVGAFAPTIFPIIIRANVERQTMLKILENDYLFHWNFVRKTGSGEDVGYGFIRRPGQYCYHKGACDAILRYYAMFLDCTFAKAHERMHKRIEGATC
jgi:hypothetical protein